MPRRTLFAMVLVSVLSSALTFAGAVLLMPKTAEAQSSVLRGTGLVLQDARGVNRLIAGSANKPGQPVDGSYAVQLYDQSGYEKLELRTAADGGAWVSFYDGNTQDRMDIALLGGPLEGTPSIWLRDATGQARVTTLVLPDRDGAQDQGGVLTVTDPSGNRIWSAP